MNLREGVWVYLSRSGISPARSSALVNYFGSEEELWSAGLEDYREAVGEKSAQLLMEAKSGSAVNAHIKAMQDRGINLLTPASEHYPKGFRDLYDPPCTVYAQGDLSLLETESIVITGTRRGTRYGRKVTALFATELAKKGLTIVTGLAEGLDAVAAEAALDAGGKVIALLCCGFDRYYPAGNAALQDRIAKEGLLLSESPPDAHAGKFSFGARARLLAGLGSAVLLTEAGEKSGTLTTVESAMELGREVFVVPGNIDSPASLATNRLMRTSAEIALSPSDILSFFGIETEAKEEGSGETAPLELSADEEILFNLLKKEPYSFDELANLTHFSPSSLNSLLTMLQLKGIIDQSAGRVYSARQ